MNLVDQKLEKASSDLEAAFERTPSPPLPENFVTEPTARKRAGAFVLALGIVAVVAVSLSFLAKGGTPVSEETPPPSGEETTPTAPEPEPVLATLGSKVVSTDEMFLPVLAGGRIYGLGDGVWIPDGNGSWSLVSYEIVGETREGWIENVDILGDRFIGIYRTLGDQINDPSDFLIYSNDAVTWHHADIVDNWLQPRWLFAAGTDRALALAKTDPPKDMTWDGESIRAWAYQWEVWSSHDGRAWELASTLDLTSMNPVAIEHRDGRFYITGRYDVGFDGIQPDPYLWTSTDGVSWQTIPVPTTGSPGNGAAEVEIINNVLVVTTREQGMGSVWALSSGEWTDVTPSGTHGGNLVPQADPAGPLFLVDGTDIWWTFDGYKWSHAEVDNFFGPTGGRSPAVAVGKTVVAVQTTRETDSRTYSIWIGTID